MVFSRVLYIFLLLQLSILNTEAQEIYEQEKPEGDFVVLHDSLKEGRFNEINFASLKGWKFSPENDPNFKSAAYDDSHWEIIKGPLNDKNFLPDGWNGFGWLRLNVKVDSSFGTKQSFIYAENSGGLELYINDSLILKQGNPGPSEKQEILFGSSTELGKPFIWEKGETYQLAVKYSFYDYEFLQAISYTSSPLDFSIGVTDMSSLPFLLAMMRGFTAVFTSSSILLFLVMMLHLFLYIRMKDEKANFWIFLLSLVLFLSTSLTTIAYDYGTSNFWTNAILSLSINTCIFLSVGLIPLVAHQVLKVKVHVFWKYFTGFPLLVLFFIIAIPEVMNETTGSFVIFTGLLVAITGGGIAIQKAKKNNRKDIYIIAGPVIGFPVIYALGNILFNAFQYENIFVELLLLFLLVTIIPLGFSVYQAKRFFRMHSHLDTMVEERTIELEKAMDNLQRSHSRLKAAQDQLVQQEKLASLGQLTAGIAHEIKNPLNFVTNFSDVCLELIEEAKSELKVMRKTKVPVGSNGNEISVIDNLKDILDTVEVNLQKIYQHGARADGIVKSMLLHSRGGSGKMEPTDLNKLVREYVNLAFHGMRASKNAYTVKIELDLDEQIEKVPLIAEDFSRVILNLCNNAFDAMREKRKDPDYIAVLQVRTLKKADQIIISIEDNGPGIEKDILDNILQPFFTTKKGTDGTGLGLSLSHEIIKAHRGKIEISSFGETGATFTITLPLQHEKELENY